MVDPLPPKNAQTYHTQKTVCGPSEIAGRHAKPSLGPPSPALTQCFYDEDDSSTESELAAEIKRVFSPMYYERKRKREEMENGEDYDDA